MHEQLSLLASVAREVQAELVGWEEVALPEGAVGDDTAVEVTVDEVMRIRALAAKLRGALKQADRALDAYPGRVILTRCSCGEAMERKGGKLTCTGCGWSFGGEGGSKYHSEP